MTEYQNTPDYQKAVFLTNEITALSHQTRMRFGAFLKPMQTSVTIASVKDLLDRLRGRYEEYLALVNEYVV